MLLPLLRRRIERQPRPDRAGVTMMEVVVTTAILGIGVMGVSSLSVHAQKGRTQVGSNVDAAMLADRKLEFLGTQPADQLPACSGLVGCRASRTEMESPLSPANDYECTQMVNGPDLSGMDTSLGEAKYRVDTVVDAHPDPRQAGAQVVTVSVCWEENGRVQQHQARRIVIPD